MTKSNSFRRYRNRTLYTILILVVLNINAYYFFTSYSNNQNSYNYLITSKSPSYRYPKIYNDDFGNAIITWSLGDGIRSQKINSSGHIQWEENGETISDLYRVNNLPQISGDGTGGAIITWEAYRTDEWDICAQRINSAGDIQWIPNGPKISTRNNPLMGQQLCSDGTGGAIIVWTEMEYGTFNMDIYTQRINRSGYIQWKENGTKICTTYNSQSHPQLCSDGLGGAIITWKDYRNDEGDIYTQRINSSGYFQWKEDKVIICNASDVQFNPQLCSDGLGGAIITWEDYRNDEWDIYAQRINSAGDIQWIPNGTKISTGNNPQMEQQLYSDGTGGAIIVWTKFYSGTFNNDIYTQRINRSGYIQWKENGTEICTTYNYQRHPQLCSDGLGGAIITWEGYRNGKFEIYAQRINSSGNIQWKENGILLYSEFSNTSQISLGFSFILYFGIGAIFLIILIHRKLSYIKK